MAIIRCTARLLDELKAKPLNADDQPVSLFDWHANLLRIHRAKCVLFSNDLTLYSFLVPAMKKPQFETFDEVFRLNLFKSLMNEHFTDKQIAYLLDGHRHIEISKTNNRSVLGSMNDLAFQCECMMVTGMVNLRIDKVNHELNRVPMGAIKYKTGINELKQRLDDLPTAGP